MDIKVRLVKLGKTQVNLLRVLHERGYKSLCPPTLSAIINMKLNTPQACRVRSEINDILKEWENDEK